MVGVIALIIYTIVGNVIEHHKLKYVHESGIAIYIGLIMGIIKITLNYSQEKFNEEIFFYIVLPPILFSAGYSMKKGNFFRNFAPIGLLGIHL
jgi:sodium/hydrogen exchanger 8